MGFIEDKNNIVQQLNLTEVLGDLPENKLISNIPSVKSPSKNLIPFLLDLLSQTCKDKEKLPEVSDRVKCNLVRIVLEILVEFFPEFMRILKEGIVKGIKAALSCPASFIIPSPTPTVTLKSNEFDANKLTSMDPTKFPGSLFFGDPDNDLNIFLSDLIADGVGSTGIWKGIMDFEVVDYPVTSGGITTSTIGLKSTINNSYSGKEYDVFLVDFINSIELFNFKNFVPNLMEEFNGAISSSLPNITPPNISGSADFDGGLNLSLEQATSKEKINTMVEKILSTDPCEQNFNLNDSFFEFNSDELLEIEKNAQNRVLGVKMVNYGCEPTLINNSSLIKNFTSSNLSEIKSDSTQKSKLVVKELTENVMSSMSNQSVNGAQNSSSTRNSLNPNINLNLNANIDLDFNLNKAISFDLALALPKLGANIIFSPKIMVLFQVSKKLITNTISSWGNNFDFAIANRVFFEYVVRESGAAFLKILYEKIKKEIIIIVTKLAADLVKELINKKLEIIKSLTGGFDVSSGLSALKA
jgi:hypothetical protein